MKVMITLTVAEGKRLIAHAVARLPEVVRAREQGRILLKAGTTVSAVAEELVGTPMRLSGRITPRGLRTANVICDAPLYMLIEGGRWRALEDDLRDTAATLGPGDVLVTGANLIDAYGGAALMAGAVFGGTIGRLASGLASEGVPVIVAAGLEKLIPGTVAQAVQAAGRSTVDRAMGMAVGLVPVHGKVITEVEAVELLAPVKCQVVGKGGMDGAEGGTALAVWGETADVERIFRLALKLKGATTSGVVGSLEECVGPNPACRRHRACIYRSPKLLARFAGE